MKGTAQTQRWSNELIELSCQNVYLEMIHSVSA